jgi:hypothetical protein
MKFIKTHHRNLDLNRGLTDQLYVDLEESYFLFKYDGDWYISSRLGPKVIIADSQENTDGAEISTKFYMKNGVNYWEGGGWYIWYTGSEWAISKKLGFGIQEEFVLAYTDDGERDEENDEWTGDQWYSSNSFNGPFTPRGTLKNNEDNESKYINILHIEGYQCDGDGIAGVYKELDESGEINDSGKSITVGLPQWKDGNNQYYIRSIEKDGDYYSYGSISFDDSKWVIGVKDSAYGWWEGSEPKITGAVTFEFKKPEGSEIEDQDNITVNFDKYITGDEKTDIHIFRVTQWLD